MSTKSSINSQGKVEHLDPESEKHEQDKASKQQFLYNYEWHQEYEVGPHASVRYPSVGKGIRMNSKGQELSSEEHIQLHLRMISERSWYWKDYKKRNGDMSRYRQDKKTPINMGDKKRGILPTGTAIHNLAINFRPDHSLALSLMDRSKISSREFLKMIAVTAGQEFEKNTPYKVISLCIHAADGNLHFHVGYTDVDENNELLHQTRNRGRKGIKRLTDRNLGLKRIHETGIEYDTAAMKKALRAYRKNMKDGKLMIDWELSKALDDTMERIKLSAKEVGYDDIFDCFAHGYAAWERQLKRRFLGSKEGVQKELKAEKNRSAEIEKSIKAVKKEADRYKAESQTLRQANEEMQASLAHISKGKQIDPIEFESIVSKASELEASNNRMMILLEMFLKEKNVGYRKEPPSKHEAEAMRLLKTQQKLQHLSKKRPEKSPPSPER